MAKFMTKSGRESNTYQTAKGNRYVFLKEQWTEVNDKDDVNWFKNQPETFNSKGIKEVIKEKKEKIEKPKKNKEYRDFLIAFKDVEDELADAIIQKYPSKKDLFTASVANLQKISGVGKYRAESIFAQIKAEENIAKRSE